MGTIQYNKYLCDEHITITYEKGTQCANEFEYTSSKSNRFM